MERDAELDVADYLQQRLAGEVDARTGLGSELKIVPREAELAEQPAALWSGRTRAPTLRDVERAYIRHVLEATGGSQTRAAGVLGISRKALWEKRRRFGID